MKNCDGCKKKMVCIKCRKQLCEIRKSGKKEYCMREGFYLIDEKEMCVDCHK
jgi:hypothetical protein